MKNLIDTIIDEGLLDDTEKSMTTGDKLAAEDMFKSWVVGEKFKIARHKGGYSLKGDFKMQWDEDVYTGPKITDVNGNFTIANTKLASLEGIFTPDAEISGTFTIEDNPNLVTLIGCPIQVNSFTVTGNKQLMSIDYSPIVLNNAYISKNGRKMNKEKLSQTMNVYKNIFCSVEPEEIITEAVAIYEAFKAPQLKVLADAIKRVSKDVSREDRFAFNDIMNIEWDKVDASQITEMDPQDKSCATELRAYCSAKKHGIVIMLNKAGEALRIVIAKRVLPVHPSVMRYDSKKLEKHSRAYDWSTTGIVDLLFDTYRNEETKVDSVLFVNIAPSAHNVFYQKRAERARARVGAIAMERGRERTGKYDATSKVGYNYGGIDTQNIRYYQKVADENRERYKKLITQLKAKRAAMSSTFMALKTRLDNAFNRYTNLLVKILQNPNKYQDYDVDWLNDKFQNSYKTSYGGHREVGLFVAIERYMTFMINSAKGENYNNVDITQKMSELEATITTRLDEVEKELTKLESK